MSQSSGPLIVKVRMPRSLILGAKLQVCASHPGPLQRALGQAAAEFRALHANDPLEVIEITHGECNQSNGAA